MLGAAVAADVLAQFAQAHTKLCEGQGAELVWRDARHKRLTPLDALKIYVLKTAPAFEAALLGGIRLAGPTQPYREAASRFARHLGVAYQMINDLDDWQVEQPNKCDSGTDILGGRPTVLWALALEGLAGDARTELESLLETPASDEARIARARELYAQARSVPASGRIDLETSRSGARSGRPRRQRPVAAAAALSGRCDPRSASAGHHLMKIVHLTAGAGNMFCGSCLHGNTLAAALRRAGEDVLLVPLYTPLRTDEEGESISHLAYGGINVYLQQRWGFFRHTPALLDRLLDSPRLLRWLSKDSSTVRSEHLGELTVSVLQGEEGRQRKELEKLVRWLESEVRPDVVHLSNVLLAGTARQLSRRLQVPVVCTLSGEEAFLEKIPEPHYSKARTVLRERAGDLAALVAMNGYSAEFMAEYLAVPRERIHVIPPGLNLVGHATPGQARLPRAGGRLAGQHAGDRLLGTPLSGQRTAPTGRGLSAPGCRRRPAGRCDYTRQDIWMRPIALIWRTFNPAWPTPGWPNALPIWANSIARRRSPFCNRST